MFEPTTLPKERAGLPLSEAFTLTTISGRDVPAATMVIPTASLLIPRFIARFEAPSTSLSDA
jgi:hypothetical protein